MKDTASYDIVVKKVIHRKETRIALVFPYDNSCLNQFKALQLPYRIENPSPRRTQATPKVLVNTPIASSEATPHPTVEQGENLPVGIVPQTERKNEIVFQDRYLRIRMPYEPEDVAFVRKLKSAYWNAKQKEWVCAATRNNAAQLQNYFQVWIKERLKYHREGKEKSNRDRSPPVLIYFETFLNQQGVTRREKYLKSGNGKIFNKQVEEFFNPR